MSLNAFKILLEFSVLSTIGLLLLDLLGLFKRLKHTIRWNKTEGKIIQSEVRKLFDLTGVSLDNFSAEIKYNYTVNGKLYESEKISFIRESRVFRERNDANRFLESFPIGKIISVFYKPQKPEIAVLIPENKEESEEHIRIQIKIIFMLLLFYIFLKVLNLSGVW